MEKNLVVVFPGGRGTEIPLLYFGAKHYEDCGYEKIFINHPLTGECDFDTLYNNAKTIIEKLSINEYENIFFIAKSIGTVVACKIKKELNISATLILFTPLEETLPYIRRNNGIILVAAGDKDRYLNSEKLATICKLESVSYYIEHGIGHRMEVMNDLQTNLTVIENVISRLQV